MSHGNSSSLTSPHEPMLTAPLEAVLAPLAQVVQSPLPGEDLYVPTGQGAHPDVDDPEMRGC